jgi:serine/threonine protein kinase
MIRPGQRIDNFRVMGKLANGGMAAVYLARDIRDRQRLVVLKVILPHLRNNPDYQAMFEREAAVGALVRHPNAVTVHGLTSWDGHAVLVMEFLDGRNLIQVISAARRRRQAISFPVVALIIAKVARAMELAWNVPGPDGEPARIIHRDISPENVVLTYDGEVKLVDFGIAKHSHIEGNTLAGQLKGKYSYMSPEQIRGEVADHNADQYAQSVLLYILLTGRKPFVAPNDVDLLRMIVSDDPVPPSQIDPTVPGALEEIALRGLRKAPEARFNDHGHLAANIEDRYLATHSASHADVRTLMSELFPADSDAVRRRIQMLVDAEREATVTGVFAELPEPEPDLTSHDETMIEIAAPSMPTANFRALAVDDNTLEPALETSIEEPTILYDQDVKPAEKRPPVVAAAPAPAALPPRTVEHDVALQPPRFQPFKPIVKGRAIALIGLALTAMVAAGLATGKLANQLRDEGPQEQLVGTIAIRSTGADEPAKVRINGTEIGTTPIEVKHATGTLRLMCSFKNRRVVVRQRIDLVAGRRSHVLCEPGHADLRITGPRGTRVSIDGKAAVAVPVSLERTMEGHYDLIWSRPGRKRTVERSIRLKPDEKRVIKHWKDLK